MVQDPITRIFVTPIKILAPNIKCQTVVKFKQTGIAYDKPVGHEFHINKIVTSGDRGVRYTTYTTWKSSYPINLDNEEDGTLGYYIKNAREFDAPKYEKLFSLLYDNVKMIEQTQTMIESHMSVGFNLAASKVSV